MLGSFRLGRRYSPQMVLKMKLNIFWLLSFCLLTGACVGQVDTEKPKSDGFDLQTQANNDQCLREYQEMGGRAFYCNQDGTSNPKGKSVFVWYSHNGGKRVSTSPLFKLKDIEKLLLYPDRVGALRIKGPVLFDDDLKGISQIEGLRQLLISGEFSNAALDHLEKLTQLEKLWISDTRITGAGIAKLKNLKSLELLHCDSVELAVNDFSELKGLPNLQYLEIYNAEDIENSVSKLLPQTSVNGLPIQNSQKANTDDG